MKEGTVEPANPPAAKDRVLFATMIKVSLQNYIADKTAIQPSEVEILRQWSKGAEREFKDAWELIKELEADGECYCADHVALPGICGHCKARLFLKRGVPVNR